MRLHASARCCSSNSRTTTSRRACPLPASLPLAAAAPQACGAAAAAAAAGTRSSSSQWRRRHSAAAAAAAASAAGAEAAASSSPPPQPSHAAADIPALKQQLHASLQGIDRGIFGVPSAKRQEVAAIVAQLEAANPLQAPARHLEQLAGSWELLYTTITITGVKKTKLGLREFIKLGAFQQVIDTRNSLALNVVHFRVAGFGLFSGSLTIKARYEVVSDERVGIQFVESTLAPDKLQQLFEKNYELLLSIFNPEGWLDVTYVDGELRVGRDDKGNIFVLRRCGDGDGEDAAA